MQRFTKFTALLTLLVLVSVTAYGQTTASLTGTVTSDGIGLPGVTVTITSPQMQGARTTVTGDGGGYTFGALPPGDYTARFDLTGLSSVTRRVQIGVGQTGRADADLKIAAVADAITVTAAAPSVLETPSISTNLSADLVEDLPLLRDPINIATLAPGVNTNTFSQDQLTISGGPGYDNLIMVNGVSITEAVRSQAIDLYIEDAIQETTVLTGGISAEYGRFTGGVVNTITKSGGNEFSGSLRDSLDNPSWTEETPGAPDHTDTLNQVWEATLGGFVMRDRLWFFGAGRDTETSTPRSLRSVPGSGQAPFARDQVDTEQRLEGKLTGQITSRHNLSASYLDVKSKSANSRFTATSYDEAQFTNREDPQNLLSLFYNGVLTNNLMIEARYSEMEWGVGWGSGSQFTDLIRGTIVRNRADSNARFNSPTFCGVCDKETRSNDNVLLKANYFLSTKTAGNHNIAAGGESFSEHRYANNYQSGSNFRVFVDSVQRVGDELYPRATPARTVFMWTPIFALQQNETDLQTDSLFVNDRWDLNNHWSFSLGARYDQNDALDASGNKVSDDSKLSPRLNATYDLFGNGRHRFTASYGDYASRIVEGPGTSAASAGNPGALYFRYGGATLNPAGTPEGQLLNTAGVLEQLFAWLNSQCNAAGQCGADNLDLLLPGGPLGGTNSVPGFDARIDGALSSPYMNEITLGYGLQFASNAVARVDLVRRSWSDFYATRVDQTTPKEVDFLGIDHDIQIIQNTNDIEREYRGIHFQTNWRPGRFNVGLNYTWSELEGNDEQESAVSGTIGNNPGSIYYSELTNFSRNLPTGYLDADQRHRVRAYVGYDVPMPRVLGQLNVSLLQNFDSGTPYGAVQLIELTDYAGQLLGSNSTYTAPDLFPQYYFTERDAFRTPDVISTNIALNYRYPIGRLELFAQGEFLNIFDEENFLAPNVAVSTYATSADARLAPFNPFTETPVECTATSAAGSCHWFKGPNFGNAASTSNLDWQKQRAYRFSLGLRF